MDESPFMNFPTTFCSKVRSHFFHILACTPPFVEDFSRCPDTFLKGGMNHGIMVIRCHESLHVIAFFALLHLCILWLGHVLFAMCAFCVL